MRQRAFIGSTGGPQNACAYPRIFILHSPVFTTYRAGSVIRWTAWTVRDHPHSRSCADAELVMWPAERRCCSAGTFSFPICRYGSREAADGGLSRRAGRRGGPRPREFPRRAAGRLLKPPSSPWRHSNVAGRIQRTASFTSPAPLVKEWRLFPSLSTPSPRWFSKQAQSCARGIDRRLQPEGATVLISWHTARFPPSMHAEQTSSVSGRGRVMGLGIANRELLASCKTYREIAESQLSKEELA